MRKILTELHLLMERADLVYIADEIVKHYNLPTKVKFSNSFKRGNISDNPGYFLSAILSVFLFDHRLTGGAGASAHLEKQVFAWKVFKISLAGHFLADRKKHN